MPMPDALIDELLAQVFRNAGAPAITGPFVVSLHTADPGTTRANEVGTGSWTNYARSSIVRSTGGFGAPASDGAGGREIANALAADFGTATVTGAAPVITHVELWDSAGTPRRIWGEALTDPQTINNTDPVSVPIGALQIGIGAAA